MIIDAKVPYDKINCSDEEYIVAESMNFMRKTLGKEWRVFEFCPSKDVAELVLREAKAKFPDKEFKIVLIKWECNEVKSGAVKMSDKKYDVEYMSVKDKGWIHYESFDTVEEAKACVSELIQETDGDAFTKDIRIVTMVDDNTAIFKKGLTVRQLIEWLQKIDPNKQIQARDNTGDWCNEIQLGELMKFVYIQSLPE